MGIGFVVLIHLVAIFILSAVIAFVWTILTRLLSKEEKRKRKILFAGLAPFIGLYTLYFLGLLGSIIVSEIKGVDLGIGDCWYIPLSDKCKLTIIDLPEQASLDENSLVLVDNLNLIQQTKDKIICKTYDSPFFIYETKTSSLTKYKNEIEFTKTNPTINLNLTNAWDFYIERKNEIAGSSFIVVGLISLFMSGFILWTIRKLLLG
jgi:hypothetical protein